MNDIQTKYFNWMSKLVEMGPEYNKLLSKLNDIPYNPELQMDFNRESDGIELRYQFGHDHKYSCHIIAISIDIRPCSVLEMMVALAYRCEMHIMGDGDLGINTGRWFKTMLRSLDLNDMDNNHFDEVKVEQVIETFLERNYSRDGKGGLFWIPNTTVDLREFDIWKQMCWFLTECKGDRSWIL